jgi:hypothetical protein
VSGIETKEIRDGHPNEKSREGNNGCRHANAVAAQPVFGRDKIVGFAVVSVVASAVTVAVRNLSWASAA